MKLALPLLLLLPVAAFAQQQPTGQKSAMQQATEAITMEQLAAHQMWRSTAIEAEAQLKQMATQAKAQADKIADLEGKNAEATKKIDDLQKKLDTAEKVQKEQSENSDKRQADLQRLLAIETEKKICDPEAH